MSRTTVAIDADGQRVQGITTDEAGAGGPLLIALHGGGFTSTYFDIAGHSLLDLAAANGLKVIALDRPGYGGSTPPPDDEVTFARNAELLDAAVGELWARAGDGHPGVVLIGHSIGGAIAMHLAAGKPSWPLLGLVISGIGDQAPEHVRAAWDSMPPGQPVDLNSVQRRMFFYGPDATIESDIVDRAVPSAAPVPLPELLEVVGNWPDDAARVAAGITVPVSYTAFEFEQLWTITPETVSTFAAHFSAAPRVESTLLPGIGHVADHHRAGPAFQLRQLAFALECAAPLTVMS